MTEKLSEQEPNNQEKELATFDLGGLDKGGLPGDLINAPLTCYYILKNLESGVFSEEEARIRLSNAKTFEDYFKDQIEKDNNNRISRGLEINDYDVCFQIELKRIDPDLIKQFDKEMMALRKLAKIKKLPTSKDIYEKIEERIKPLIRGREEK